jgi:hypothetical protein
MHQYPSTWIYDKGIAHIGIVCLGFEQEFLQPHHIVEQDGVCRPGGQGAGGSEALILQLFFQDVSQRGTNLHRDPPTQQQHQSQGHTQDFRAHTDS